MQFFGGSQDEGDKLVSTHTISARVKAYRGEACLAARSFVALDDGLEASVQELEGLVEDVKAIASHASGLAEPR